jgi:deoxyribose-phosphate aldolase
LTTNKITNIAQYIDHTLLKPDALSEDFERHCLEAIQNKFYSVCVPPAYVSFCKRILKASTVKVCTVIGFPFGYNTTAEKTFATKMAVDQGADELDMVIAISALKSGDQALVLDDIRSVVHAASGRVVKVILETCLLTNAEKTLGCELAQKAGAHFVKTSTGFSTGGATESDVELMVGAVAHKLSVKASGGIRDYLTAAQFIRLGATRLGTSHGVTIVTGENKNSTISENY